MYSVLPVIERHPSGIRIAGPKLSSHFRAGQSRDLLWYVDNLY